MNKYFIGYPIPEEAKQVIRNLRLSIHDAGEMVPDDQLHITAFYIGKATFEQANAVIEVMADRVGRHLPPNVRFTGFIRLSGCLALAIHDCSAGLLVNTKKLLEEQAMKLGASRSVYPGYIPHVTITKSRRAFCMAPVSEALFPLNTICLYEKQEGGEYQEVRILRFYPSIREQTEALVRAVEELPVVQWIPVAKRKPEKGEEVLIWPREAVNVGQHESYPVTAIYGTRYTAKGGFYMYGRVLHPTHWMRLPEGPERKERRKSR